MQTEHLGWDTDDFLIVCKNDMGQFRKLAGQVKRTLTISAANEECKKAMKGLWNDFKNSHLFSSDSDRLVLVTLRGTDTLLKHFSGLLDFSRSSCDEEDFLHRLQIPGLISHKAIHQCREIQKIIREVENRDVSLAEIWPLLRILHVLSLDLNSGSAQTEAMIKCLLAHPRDNPGARSAADATWNDLLSVASQGMSEARRFQRRDLPEALIRRHNPLADTDQQMLRALDDHSKIILDSIRSEIGSLHLERDGLVQQVMEKLDSNQIVLISGAAGSGKSVIAKDAIHNLANDHFVFGFRGEEYAHPHLDETLQSVHGRLSGMTLGAIMAGQNRKILLVESIERLLEKSTRDAFEDLLTLIGKDKSWQMLLTCRDYAIDLVRTAFLTSKTVGHSVIDVPSLDNEELEIVQSHYPQLAHPLANPGLRRVLSNPYVLDMALRIQWSEQGLLPQSKREFRDLFWREIVRAEHRYPAGMPQQREKTFVEISLRRARALTLYANCGDLDPVVVENLRGDSLILRSHESGSLLAPAHDVMEDWAILHWIHEQYVTHADSLQNLSDKIGGHPAVRRTYRKWVTELVETDPKTADYLFMAAIFGVGIPDHFRDDMLTSLLRSSSSSTLLEKYKSELFENNNRLFLQLIHLLRVACVTPNTELGFSAIQPSLFNIPDGDAWACILKLAANHLVSFAEKDRILLFALIEDWSRSVSLKNPYPDGAKDVTNIAYWLLSYVKNYGLNDYLKKILKVIARIPNADPERFSALLQGSREANGQDFRTKNFRQMLFQGLEGVSVARDMPDLVVSVSKDYLLLSESDFADGGYYRGSLDLTFVFGIKGTREFGFHPASAFRGPFLPLLRNHPWKGLDLIIDVLNHSTKCYARQRKGHEVLEPPFEMELLFTDGTSRKQWCNTRLWNLYRGTSIGPEVLQCILMAVEYWLLELAEARPDELDQTLINLLQRSNSGALTAVVASVATAFPHFAGETLLVLLRSRLCIQLDRQRLVNESQAPTTITGFSSRLNGENVIYEHERKKANARPHRELDLEVAILKLQLSPFAPGVHIILDQHLAGMPPLEEQKREDRIWRLAVHRMDIRGRTVAEKAPEIQAPIEGCTTGDVNLGYFYLEPKDPEPDLKEMIEHNAEEREAMNAKLRLLNWGGKVFEKSNDPAYDPIQWRQKLQEARDTETGKTDNNEPNSTHSDASQPFYSRFDGAEFVAAICVRDHWDEISVEEREWCVNIICSAVDRESNNWSNLERVQRHRSSVHACAWVLPLLFGKSLSGKQQPYVHQTLVVALTHAIKEVRSYATMGIGQNLWKIDRDLALHCVNVLAKQSSLVQHEVTTDLELQEKNSGDLTPKVGLNSQKGRKWNVWRRLFDCLRGRPSHTKFSWHGKRSIDEIEANVASIVRKRFKERNWISGEEYRHLRQAEGFEPIEANKNILNILEWAPTELVAIEAFEDLGCKIVSCWDEETMNRNIDFKLRDHLLNFLLQTSLVSAKKILQPILNALERHPRDIYPLVLGLVSLEARQPNTPQFWSLWKLFADKIRTAQWLKWIDDQHATGSEIISVIFLGNFWKEGISHWKSLDGYVENVHALFEDLPPSSTVLDDYVRFLYQIGAQSLPNAFIRIAARLREGDPKQMMKKENTVFQLEVLLQRYVYWRPQELKRQKDLREAVLFLLNILVQAGSSAAFRMRDDFVTPMPKS